MNFDEWWNDQFAGAPIMVFDTEEEIARAAWNAARRIEREECAKICEQDGLGTKYQGDVYAYAIRSKA